VGVVKPYIPVEAALAREGLFTPPRVNWTELGSPVQFHRGRVNASEEAAPNAT